MKNITLSLLLSLCIGGVLRGQQEAQFTHYMYNTLWLNPAYAGTRNALTVAGIYRAQWTGFEGAPVAQTLTLHGPVFNRNLGLGLSVLNDKIGVTRSTTVALDLAYQFRINRKSKLSIGLKGMMGFYTNNLSLLHLENPNDLAFSKNYYQTLFNAGIGVYYYRKRFYAGISTPSLINRHDNGLQQQPHFYVISGVVVDLSEEVKFKPSCLIKVTMDAPLQADLTASFLFMEKLSLGMMYRTGDGAGLLLGVNLTREMAIGYSFDWSVGNTTGRYNSGSHELMLRYDMIPKKLRARIKSPRYLHCTF